MARRRLGKEIRYRKPPQPPHRFVTPRSRTVRDFDSRDDLIAHARDEGATHVVVVGSGATLYYPFQTAGGSVTQYEEARAWRQNGYWHVPAPGSRKVVDQLPRGAEPIDAYLGGGRRAAESHEPDPGLVEALATAVDDLRSTKGITFEQAYDQIAKPAWVHQYDPVYVGNLVINKAKSIGRRRGGIVRDYVPVDHRGRPLSGPTKDYSAAKREADQAGGYVKFDTGRPPAMEEAWGRSVPWSDWMILDAIDKGNQVPPEAEARAVKLAQRGLIDTTGTWRLTARGRRAVDQRVPVAAEAPATRKRGGHGFQRGGRRAGQMTADFVMRLARELSRELGGGEPKPLPGGFRYSERNESAVFATHSPDYGQKVVLVVSVFEDGSTAINVFSDENLSETDRYENISSFTYRGADVRSMVEDVHWVWKTVDGYAESWQEPEAEVDEARPRLPPAPSPRALPRRRGR